MPMETQAGERWAALVMTTHLRQLILYESSETTLRYHAGANADRTNDTCRAADERPLALRGPPGYEGQACPGTASEDNQQNHPRQTEKPLSRP